MSATAKRTFRRVIEVFVRFCTYTEKLDTLFLDQYTLFLDQFHLDLLLPRLVLDQYSIYF